jgi:dipeptidyl aminopeptidase/acylaminoacyl peptidase
MCSTTLAAAPPLSAYGELPGLADAAISPSGNRIAVIGAIGGKRALIVMSADKKPLTQVAIGDNKVRYIDWIGEEQVLVVLTQTEKLGLDYTTDKAEFSKGMIIPVQGDKIEYVFQKQRDIVPTIFGDYGIRNVNGVWTGYYGALAIERNLQNQTFFKNYNPTLYALDFTKNIAKKADGPAPSGRSKSWILDENGDPVVKFEMESETGKWQIRNVSGLVLKEGVDPLGQAGLVTLGKDGDTIIYSIVGGDDGRVHWYEMPLDGGKEQEVLADTEVDRLYIDHLTGRWLGYLKGGENPEAILFDPVKQNSARKIRKTFGKLHVRMEDWNQDFTKFLVNTSGNGDSGTWWLVDTSANTAVDIGYERILVNPGDVGSISTIAYTAADGMAMDGILTLPPGKSAVNLPTIMLPHGGPHSHDQAQFDWWAQAFASRGYAVFQPNFRGSTNRNEAFVRAGYGEWGKKMQTDISDGLAELVKRGISDPKRVCIMGASYGGYAALAGVTLQNGLYKCSVSVAGVSDLRKLYYTELRESGGNALTRRNLKQSIGEPSGLDQVSPNRFAARADAPILLIHGKDDTVVRFDQSKDMADALQSAGKPYDLVVLKEEDHWLSREETRKQMLDAAMAFVLKHNPPQ